MGIITSPRPYGPSCGVWKFPSSLLRLPNPAFRSIAGEKRRCKQTN